MNRKILTIDGGGIKGIIPAIICTEIEKHTGKKINEIFHLISGGSTGSILGAGLALGVPASKLVDMYIDYGHEIFTERTKWYRPWEYLTKPKYEKKYIKKHLTRVYGKDTVMTDIHATKFMSAACDVVNKKYEFFTSWQQRYANDKLVDVVIYSISAPYLFGRTKDNKRKTFYSDGAIGPFKSTPLTASVEASKLGWFDGDDTVSILSLGCGQSNEKRTFNEVDKWNNIDEIFEIYMSKEVTSINGLKDSIIKHLLLDKVKVYDRINPEINSHLTPLDEPNNILALTKIGYKCAKTVVTLDILK